MMATTYVPIQSVTLASSAASVSFSAIPQTFTDLVVRISARSDTGDTNTAGFLRFNGDSSVVYSNRLLQGDGSSAGSGSGSGTSAEWYYINGSLSGANTFASAEIYIPSYTSTTNKPFSMTNVWEANSATAYIDTFAHLYRGTSAISSILVDVTGNFVAGSTFHLYGIKNS